MQMPARPRNEESSECCMREYTVLLRVAPGGEAHMLPRERSRARAGKRFYF